LNTTFSAKPILKAIMDYEEPAAVVVDPDQQWAIDLEVEPLVNVATFGWTEGE